MEVSRRSSRSQRRVTFAAAIGIAMGVGACSLALISDDDPCKVDADCTARGAEFAGAICAGGLCSKGLETSGTAGSTSGESGSAGVSGASGTSGTAGSSGESGTAGVSGTSGTSGTAGAGGTGGTGGTAGSAGESGTSGSAGESGSSGTAGARDAGMDVEIPEKWSCVGNVTWRTGTGQVTLSGPINNALGGQPIPGVRFRACSKIDVDCAAPSQETYSDATGYVSITLSNGFDGYIEISKDDYYPIMLFTNPPISMDVVINTGLGLFTPAQFTGLAAAAGVSVDPTRGHMLTLVRDCDGVPAAGVTVSLNTADAMSKPIYLRNGLPSPTAMSTDDSGLGGFLNTPTGVTNPNTGFAEVSAKVADLGLTIGYSSILIRKGTMSAVVPLIPSPLN